MEAMVMDKLNVKSLSGMVFNEKIKFLRESKGLTQGALAKKTGISVAEICRIEKGERLNPSINLVNKLLKGLEVNIETYLNVTGFEI